MKNLLALIFILAMAGSAFAQSTTPLPLPADRIVSNVDIINTNCPGDVTAGGCVVINTQGTSSISVIISGGWQTFLNGIQTNGIVFEGTPADSGGWIPVSLVNSQTLSVVAQTTTGGYWVGGIGGYRKFRVRLFGIAGGAARVTLNAAAGQPPKFDANRQYTIYQVYDDTQTIGITYPVSNCTYLKNVQLSINATGVTGDMMASIEIAYTQSGPWFNYKQLPIGNDLPSIYNGVISAPYFHVLIPYAGSDAGTVTISGGCKQ